MRVGGLDAAAELRVGAALSTAVSGAAVVMGRFEVAPES